MLTSRLLKINQNSYKSLPKLFSAHTNLFIESKKNLFTYKDNRKEYPQSFLNAIQNNSLKPPSFIYHKTTLKSVLQQADSNIVNNYIYENFITWVSLYASQNKKTLDNYFSNKIDLTYICKNFINFCFNNNIQLDAEESLNSFSYHNNLSDHAVKNELKKILPKKSLNILGYGLDNGMYEKTIAHFLLNEKISNEIQIYGFDPYANKDPKIIYLTQNQLIDGCVPKFDIIISRWVLHHVELKNRWEDFTNCINNCNTNATILIVEHGFLKNPPHQLEKKVYEFLNATFDIIANIGIRPYYFTSSKIIGENFFLHYLEQKDFQSIKESTIIKTNQSIYDIGPDFPNQTICCMRTLK